MRKKSRFPIIPGPYWGALPFRRKVGAEHELHDRFLIPRPKIDRETTATHVESRTTGAPVVRGLAKQNG